MKRVFALFLLVSSVVYFLPYHPDTAQAANFIQTENAKAGTADWKITNPGYATGVIEGYASRTSVNRGEQIKLFVNTSEPNFSMDIFRIGYYGGLGGRRMMPTINQTGTAQPSCPMDSFGTVECHWTNPYVLTIPNTADPTDWMSGIYLVKLTAGTSGKQQYITFTVRDDTRRSDLLLIQAVSTYQAYNIWGVYGTIANRADTANKAEKVSFDRPYYGDETYGAGLFFDKGDFRSWEYGMVNWAEAEGYDISYATTVDVDRDPNILLNHKALLTSGHDEYWSWKQRDNIEAAVKAGVNIGFFSGNTSYWQVRFENSVATGEPGRIMVGYKEHVASDPITPDYLKTTLFRNAPVNRSEDALLGVRFITQARPPFCVEDASHWVFTGTGLKNGDCLKNPDGTSFLGYEVDAMGPFSPANTQRLAHSPATPAYANFDDMTIYRAPSGATVFNTGSISWSYTIPQIQQITRNVLARFIAGAFTDAPAVRPALPAPFVAADIGDVGRLGFVAQASSNIFALNGAGKAGFTNTGPDAFYYVYQPLSGDGEIVARLNNLQLYWDNRAGIMIRESLAPDSRYVSIVGTPSESRGAVNEGAEFRVKDVVGGKANKLASRDQLLPNWLKLSRTGNNFNAYISADGTNWTSVGTTTLALNSNAYVGLAVASAQYGVWASASFDNVQVTAGGVTPTPTPVPPPPPASTLPTGWSNQDIGAVGPAGSSTYNPTTSTFSVTGAGADIWNSTDAFQYTYTPLTGDGRIVARVASIQNVAAWTKAGVMIRESTNANSAHGFMLASAGKGLAFQRRVSTGGLSTSTPGGLINAPIWVRLDRVGNTITAYQSQDGSSWVQVGSDTFTMGSQVFVGLAVTSHTTATAATATFDHVSVINLTTTTPPPPPPPSPTPSPTPTPVPPPAPPPPPPSGCAVALDKTSIYVGAGALGTVAATWYINAATTSGCAYTAATDSPWLELKNPTTGVYSTNTLTFTGSASIKVHALANTGPKRIGHFTIGGITYTVTQDPG
ncbi:MAG: hypothetical protein KW788_03440 [Candidatus Doudnabacteria bacterium]|nr:hypothetical protein [Candidatus Doudnabacteria bacterium]